MFYPRLLFHAMKLGEKITTNRFVHILLILSIILSLTFSIVVFIGNRSRFDNKKVNGFFKGDVLFPDQPAGKYSLNITFDGKREYSGVMIINQTIYEITAKYTCIEYNVEFLITPVGINSYFSLNGIISDMGTFLEGDVRYYITSNDYIDGTFFITKYT